jgi:hypothetical protein
LKNGADYNSDNLLRNLRDARYSSSASAFCTSYSQAAVTAPISTFAPVTIVPTVTPDPIVIPKTASIIYAITIPYTTTTGQPSVFEKRNAPLPSWLPGTYPTFQHQLRLLLHYPFQHPADNNLLHTTMATVTITFPATTFDPLTTATTTSTITTAVAAIFDTGHSFSITQPAF